MSNNAAGVDVSRVQTRDGLSLHVTARGPADAAVIILVHGFPDASQVWDGVAEELSARWRVVTYDVRGAGASEAPATRDGYAMELLADDLFRVKAAVSATRRAHLVAHDWGSIQSWEAITDDRAPAQFATFTSISGPCLDHIGHWLRRAHKHPLLGMKQALKSGYIYAFHLPKVPELVMGSRAARRLLEGGASFRRDGANGVNLYRENMRQHLFHPRQRRTDIPVLLLVPLRDPFVSPVLLAEVELWASDVTRRELDAGHWVPRTHPQQVAAEIAAFAEQRQRATLGR